MERLNLSDDSLYVPAELAIHVARYLPVAELVRGKRVLDLACGEGLGAYIMKTRFGAREVVGVDVSSETILNARATFAEEGLIFQIADAIEFLERPTLGRFDVVTCIETIEHLSDPEALLDVISRAVRGTGLIYITCPNDDWYFGPEKSLNQYHLSKYTAEQFFAAAEEQLGAAEHRWNGTVLAGFATFPASPERVSYYRTGLDVLSEKVRSVAIPESLAAAPEQVLDGQNCLYYAGLWNLTGEPTTQVAGVAAWPAGASYRQPPITSLPKVVQALQAATKLTIAHRSMKESRAAAIRLRDALDGRLIVALQEIDPLRPETIIELGRAKHGHFLHFADEVTAAELFDALPALADTKLPDSFAWRIAQPITTFSAIVPSFEEPSFWHSIAYLLDGYFVDGTHPRVHDPLAHKPKPELLPTTDDELIRAFFRLLRRAEITATNGLQSARFAEIARRLRSVRPPTP